jgi:hypothetical protein
MSITLPGVPEGYEIVVTISPYCREQCITLRGHGKEYAESFVVVDDCFVNMERMNRIYAHLAAQADIKFIWSMP